MEYIISIDDKTTKGKMLLALLDHFSKTTSSVEFLSPAEVEEMEDKIFLKMMEEGRKSGKADTKKVLKKLDIK